MRMSSTGPAVRRTAWVALLAVAALGMPPARAEEAHEVDVPPDLQKQIDQAIEKGAKWLLTEIGEDGLFAPLEVNSKPAYVIGATSLCGLALLAADLPRDAPPFPAMLASLKARDALEAAGSRTTYNCGALLMFLTEYYRPALKPAKDHGRYVRPKEKDPCGLPPDVQVWVQELASFLVSAQLEDGWWRYPFAPPSDLSNTQYALLGLRAARDCGATVPATTFLRALVRALDQQQATGEEVKRVIPPSGKPGDKGYVTSAGDRARGWGYQEGNAATGSMTTAGIAALAIGRDMLMKPERFSSYTDELDRKVGRAVQDGFAWLDKNFSVERNPCGPPWHYYYLYGLERACVFAGRSHVGQHNWYVEGAKYLVGHQGADGRWNTGALGVKEVSASDLCDTAWAILFLKRATRPTKPIPVPEITTGG